MKWQKIYKFMVQRYKEIRVSSSVVTPYFDWPVK